MQRKKILITEKLNYVTFCFFILNKKLIFISRYDSYKCIYLKGFNQKEV